MKNNPGIQIWNAEGKDNKKEKKGKVNIRNVNIFSLIKGQIATGDAKAWTLIVNQVGD